MSTQNKRFFREVNFCPKRRLGLTRRRRPSSRSTPGKWDVESQDTGVRAPGTGLAECGWAPPSSSSRRTLTGQFVFEILFFGPTGSSPDSLPSPLLRAGGVPTGHDPLFCDSSPPLTPPSLPVGFSCVRLLTRRRGLWLVGRDPPWDRGGRAGRGRVGGPGSVCVRAPTGARVVDARPKSLLTRGQPWSRSTGGRGAGPSRAEEPR